MAVALQTIVLHHALLYRQGKVFLHMPDQSPEHGVQARLQLFIVRCCLDQFAYLKSASKHIDDQPGQAFKRLRLP